MTILGTPGIFYNDFTWINRKIMCESMKCVHDATFEIDLQYNGCLPRMIVFDLGKLKWISIIIIILIFHYVF